MNPPWELCGDVEEGALAKLLPGYGIIPGFALDLSTADEDGNLWDFTKADMRAKAEKKVKEEKLKQKNEQRLTKIDRKAKEAKDKAAREKEQKTRTRDAASDGADIKEAAKQARLASETKPMQD